MATKHCKCGIKYIGILYPHTSFDFTTNHRYYFRMNDKFIELVEKVQNDTATPEEELTLLEVLNSSVISLRLLLKEVKMEQLKQSITSSN
ncbi:MAG: hypothetical protein IPJ53_13330 [Saprospiraceae bacterium]|nr:hypothetical protein [Candidatus Vicinibacter affinis]